jgi:hypothetical protein
MSIIRCLDTAQVPQAWNIAEMFVLYKGKGPVDSGDSYRAISLTDIIGKLFERVIFARVMSWFESSHLSHLPQFGFRPNSSTQDAVLTLRSVIHAHKVVIV